MLLGRFTLPAIVLVGLVLLAPSLAMGFHVDDYVHQLVLRGDDEMVPMRPWALYDFGTREDWTGFGDRVGSFPWWTGDDWRVRFFRPLSSVVLWGTHTVFGDWAAGYHLVSLALYAALLFSIHGLYRNLGLTDWRARAGTLLFALCDAAVVPVAWPANQNSLLVAVFSVLALRTLSGRVSAARVTAGVLLACAAVLSKESGCAALVVCAAYLAGRARSATSTRGRAALWLGATVCTALALAYILFLVSFGYGTRSLFYATPWEDPARYAGNLVTLYTSGFVSLAGPFPLDAVMLFPSTKLALTLVGAALGVPLVAWVARTVRGMPGTSWLALWTIVFLGVQAGGPPADRLLFVPAVGASGLLACFFSRRYELAVEWKASRIGRVFTGVLLVFATLGSVVFFLAQSFGLTISSRYLRERALETEVGPPSLGHRNLFVVQTESQMQAFTIHSVWGHEMDDQDLVFRLLQSSNRPVRWTRVEENTFDLETLGSAFLTEAFELVYLDSRPRIEVGDTWKANELTVEALAVDDGYPIALRFRLTDSLDAQGNRFLRSEGGRLAVITPPAIGESIELETPERAGPYVP